MMECQKSYSYTLQGNGTYFCHLNKILKKEIAVGLTGSFTRISILQTQAQMGNIVEIVYILPQAVSGYSR